MIETRKSASLNLLLQKFQSCQITIFARRSSDIQFLFHSKQSRQIFVFQSTENLAHKILKERNSTYPVFLGLHYIHKFSTPVCKLNVFSLAQNEREPVRYFVSFLKHFVYTIALNNNLMFRSVYCGSKIFSLVLIRKQIQLDSTLTMLRELSNLLHIKFFKLLTIGLMPLDNLFLNPIIRIQILALIGEQMYSANSYSDTLVDELTCRIDQDTNTCESR